jgi:hypothetical protein
VTVEIPELLQPTLISTDFARPFPEKFVDLILKSHFCFYSSVIFLMDSNFSEEDNYLLPLTLVIPQRLAVSQIPRTKIHFYIYIYIYI